MGDREEILVASRVRSLGSGIGSLELELRSQIPGLESEEGGLGIQGWLSRFINVAKEVGGDVAEASRENVNLVLEERFPGVSPVYAEDLTGTEELVSLKSLELFVCEGVLGVAENGAIWIPESRMGERVAPFVTQHLAIVLDKTQIVADMHTAYERIDIAAEGFGVFVAGPSKTADIEQSLVLGAHGPRSLLVVLVQD